jgi:hypothetical protein
MSSSGDDPEDAVALDGPAANWASRLLWTIRTSWELPELGAVGILIAIAVLAAAGLASGIVGSTTQGIGFPPHLLLAELLVESTQWAGVPAAFFLLGATGLIWWQVQGWSEALQDDAADSIALRHLRRGRALALWTGVSFVISSAATIGTLVGVLWEGGATPFRPWVSASGQVVAALILAGVGIYALVAIRARCDTACAEAQDATEAAPS